MRHSDLTETKRLHVNSQHEADPADPASGYGRGRAVGQSLAEPALTQGSYPRAFSAGTSTTARLLPRIGLGVVEQFGFAADSTQATELVLVNSSIFGPNGEQTPWTVLSRVD